MISEKCKASQKAWAKKYGAAKTRAWRARNLEKYRAAARARNRRSNMKNKYGITEEQYSELLNKQGHVCAICGCNKPESREWAIDHCHITNKVRGILCHQCNTAIGLMQDNVEILSAAIDYLSG